ncbi:hypothetical protein [Novosphingobium album (ex Liu et al. 2023)]|uniref:Uncharacterized protein n=1 Tax=Novosphingobium album (ex Liu et al. 2023) TaxID=3031130 RepID=A0ABT5WVJ9_9SPHN|nr:hypothetical protein [Novosphingobium album (ex Liu et al. 2023)]MDE8653940.1 hypothetical protein [Novosphingobium album (ex Liu et al. 2023)]
MDIRRTFALTLAPLALAACGKAGPAEPPPPSPAAEVIGAAQDCLPLASFSSTQVRDDWTIDFLGAGQKAWRNTLPNRCPGLRAESAFTYETSLSQLCGTDIIYVLQRTGGSLQRGAGCGLGKFVPVKLAK